MELANRSFIYEIILTNTSVTIPANILLIEQNLFVYINIPTRYMPQEIYGIMINTGTLCRSIAGYKQYFANKKFSNINIDII
jgi:hypothetical protein